MSDLIERLEADLTPEVHEEYMLRWDAIRRRIIEGDRGDLPRLCFETILEDKDDLLREATSEITRLRSIREGWRSIETAPKDGSVFLVWADGFEWPEAVRWDAYDAETAEEVGEPGYWTYADELLANATDDCGSEDWSHWMPLPASPALSGDEKLSASQAQNQPSAATSRCSDPIQVKP